MAASKTALKAGIKAAMIAEYDGTPSAPQTASIDNIAGAIADEVAQFVDDYVKTSGTTHVLLAGQVPVTGTITITGTTIT